MCWQALGKALQARHKVFGRLIDSDGEESGWRRAAGQRFGSGLPL